MKRKISLLLFLLVFLVVAAVGAVNPPKNTNAEKKGGKIGKGQMQTVEKEKMQLLKDELEAQATSGEEKLEDLKEEMNKSMTDLKGQIDKVKGDNSDAKVGGLVFFQWQRGGTTPNSFDVTRAYLDAKKKLDKNASARLTLDVSRIPGVSKQNLFDYLKYAYVEVPLNLSGMQLVPFNMSAKIGLQQTVWIDWADKILNLRYVAKSLVDNESIMSSADFGLGAFGKLMIPGLPDIEYQATLLNGTGYATNESNGQKAVAMRINTVLFENAGLGKVIFGCFGNIEALDASLSYTGSNTQSGAMLALKGDYGAVNLEYILGSKSNNNISGYSTGIVYNLGSLTGWLAGFGAFYRLDNYDPNTSASNDEKKKTFYGLTYDYGNDLRFAADTQTSQTGSGAISSIFYLQSSIAF